MRFSGFLTRSVVFSPQCRTGALQLRAGPSWANTNGIELQVEQRFARGYAFQLSYDLLNAFASTGANGGAAGTITELNQYLPGAVPSSYDARNRFLNYQRDANVPKHRVKWNGLIDLPFGKGKKFGGNASAWLDKLIGEMTRTRCDILSVVLPIKDGKGLTSTGYMDKETGLIK